VKWAVNWAASGPIEWNLYAAHFRGLWLTCVTLSHLSDERLRPAGMMGFLDGWLLIIPPPILALKCQVSHFGPLSWNVLADNSRTRAQFFVATKWHEAAFKCPSSCYTVERAARILLGNILPQKPNSRTWDLWQLNGGWWPHKHTYKDGRTEMSCLLTGDMFHIRNICEMTKM